VSGCACGCGRPAYAHGFAHACLERWRYHGKPETVPAATRKGNDGKAGDRLEDFAELTREWGLPLAAAADRLGVHFRTAQRYDAKLRRAS